MPKKPKASQVLGKFLREEPQEQVYSRIPRGLHQKFMQIVQSESITIYKGVEIAITLLTDFYASKELRDFYEKIKERQEKSEKNQSSP